MTRRDVLAAAVLTVVVMACGVIGSDYEPTDETFRRRVGTFILDRAINVDPIYGNIDVDSLWGQYVVNDAAPNEVLGGILGRATQLGWTLEQQRATESQFHKRTGSSYEIVRVICRGQQPVTVYVAWLQIDGATTSIEARESVEGKWAAREFWPRFERAVTSQ